MSRKSLIDALLNQAPVLVVNAFITGLAIITWPLFNGWQLGIAMSWAMALVWVAIRYKTTELDQIETARAYRRGRTDQLLDSQADEIGRKLSHSSGANS